MEPRKQHFPLYLEHQSWALLLILRGGLAGTFAAAAISVALPIGILAGAGLGWLASIYK